MDEQRAKALGMLFEYAKLNLMVANKLMIYICGQFYCATNENIIFMQNVHWWKL